MWVAIEKSMNVCGLIVYKSQICEKVLKKILFFVY
jgi:hypothetical protein